MTSETYIPLLPVRVLRFDAKIICKFHLVSQRKENDNRYCLCYTAL